MMDYAAEKIRESHRRILEGEIGPKPYRRGQDTGCDYCRYRISADLIQRSRDMDIRISGN